MNSDFGYGIATTYPPPESYIDEQPPVPALPSAYFFDQEPIGYPETLPIPSIPSEFVPSPTPTYTSTLTDNAVFSTPARNTFASRSISADNLKSRTTTTNRYAERKEKEPMTKKKKGIIIGSAVVSIVVLIVVIVVTVYYMEYGLKPYNEKEYYHDYEHVKQAINGYVKTTLEFDITEGAKEFSVEQLGFTKKMNGVYVASRMDSGFSYEFDKSYTTQDPRDFYSFFHIRCENLTCKIIGSSYSFVNGPYYINFRRNYLQRNVEIVIDKNYPGVRMYVYKNIYSTDLSKITSEDSAIKFVNQAGSLPITEIPEKLCSKSSLVAVLLPNTVTRICAYAFSETPHLERIHQYIATNSDYSGDARVLQSSNETGERKDEVSLFNVRVIDGYAFRKSSITRLALSSPASLSIGEYSFSFTKLNSIVIKDVASDLAVGFGAFYDAEHLYDSSNRGKRGCLTDTPCKYTFGEEVFSKGDAATDNKRHTLTIEPLAFNLSNEHISDSLNYDIAIIVNNADLNIDNSKNTAYDIANKVKFISTNGKITVTKLGFRAKSVEFVANNSEIVFMNDSLMGYLCVNEIIIDSNPGIVKFKSGSLRRVTIPKLIIHENVVVNELGEESFSSTTLLNDLAMNISKDSVFGARVFKGSSISAISISAKLDSSATDLEKLQNTLGLVPVVPFEVTEDMFSESKLKTLTFSNNVRVTKIAENGMANMLSLSSLAIPTHRIVIEDGSFHGTPLTSLELQGSVSSVGRLGVAKTKARYFRFVVDVSKILPGHYSDSDYLSDIIQISRFNNDEDMFYSECLLNFSFSSNLSNLLGNAQKSLPPVKISLITEKMFSMPIGYITSTPPLIEIKGCVINNIAYGAFYYMGVRNITLPISKRLLDETPTPELIFYNSSFLQALTLRVYGGIDLAKDMFNASENFCSACVELSKIGIYDYDDETYENNYISKIKWRNIGSNAFSLTENLSELSIAPNIKLIINKYAFKNSRIKKFKINLGGLTPSEGYIDSTAFCNTNITETDIPNLDQFKICDPYNL